MSLYRKYRPQKFNEVISQGHVTQTLQGALAAKQIGHAYIFAGPRGTGKTSVARILAKAVNCLDLVDAEVCGKCEVCRQIAEGIFLDLIEIDAASNRGIDEIRDLKEKIRFAPNIGKYKVYIIDEVHMLTKDAFNALLKTLEEPPSHVIFILATTEVHKIPLTIISRCQRFDFHKIANNKMFEGIKKIAKLEKIKIDEASLRKIVTLSEGSIRDALSYLEQVYAFSGGRHISPGILYDILGYSKQENLFNILKLIKEKDIRGVINFINQLIEDGIDLEVFLKDLTRFIRQLLLFKVDRKILESVIEEKEEIEYLAKGFTLSDLVKLAEALAEVVSSAKFSFFPQLYLELAILKILREGGGLSDLEAEEHKARQNIGIKVREISDAKKKVDEENVVEDAVEEIAAKETEGVEEDTGRGEEEWENFLQKIKEENLAIFMALQGTSFSLQGEEAIIKISNQFYFDRLQESKNFQFLGQEFKKYFGKKKKLKIIKEDKKESKEHNPLSEALAVLGGEVIE